MRIHVKILCILANDNLSTFASANISHLRSKYFTFAKQIFHSVDISLARRANFVKKSTCLRKCFFLAGRAGFEPAQCQSQSLVPYRLATSQYYRNSITHQPFYVNMFLLRFFFLPQQKFNLFQIICRHLCMSYCRRLQQIFP